MPPKHSRLTTAEIDSLFVKGAFFQNDLFLARASMATPSPRPKVAFLATKKVAATAVSRHSLRRRGYAALSPMMKTFPPDLQVVFQYKKKPEHSDAITTALTDLLSKILR